MYNAHKRVNVQQVEKLQVLICELVFELKCNVICVTICYKCFFTYLGPPRQMLTHNIICSEFSRCVIWQPFYRLYTRLTYLYSNSSKSGFPVSRTLMPVATIQYNKGISKKSTHTKGYVFSVCVRNGGGNKRILRKPLTLTLSNCNHNFSHTRVCTSRIQT